MSKQKPGDEPLTKEEAAIVKDEVTAQTVFEQHTPLTSGPTAAQVAQEHHERHDTIVGPKGDHESQADYDARVLRGGPPVKAVVHADLHPLATPVTLHLMDADERAVLDRVQVRVRPFIFELNGNRFQQVREQPDGSWIYHHLVK